MAGPQQTYNLAGRGDVLTVEMVQLRCYDDRGFSGSLNGIVSFRFRLESIPILICTFRSIGVETAVQSDRPDNRAYTPPVQALSYNRD